MSTKLSDLKVLTGKFAIFSRRGYWKIECFHCDARFTLRKTPDLHPGNLLHLLNHAASHPPTPEPDPEHEEIIPARVQREYTSLRRPRPDLL